MKRRGVGLGVTLVIVGLLTMVGFSLAALSVGRIQLLGQLQNQRRAHEAALSAVQMALGKLRSRADYGVSGADPLVSVMDPQGASGRVAFGTDLARASGLPPSLNNLAGLTALSTPVNVPAASARLVAEGRAGSARELLEVLVSQPVFPFALASTGAIRSSRGLVVASMEDDRPTSLQALLADPVHLGKPANLLSNSLAPDSIQVLGPSTICGDVQSAGQVDLSGSPITILGELREHQSVAAVPDIPLSSVNLGGTPTRINGASSNSPVLEGAYLCEGPYECSGDLTLRGAGLYVKGNLKVGGELRGSGCLVVEGTTTVHGSTDLTSPGKLALISQGDITLSGESSSRSYFKGVVYTKGRLRASQLAVLGCLLGAAPGPGGAQIELEDCVLVQCDSSFAPMSPTASYQMQLLPCRAEQFDLDLEARAGNQVKLTFTAPDGSNQSLTANVNDSASCLALRRTLRRLAESQSGDPLDRVVIESSAQGAPLELTMQSGAEGELQSQLQELRRRLVDGRQGDGPSFDLNQFLQSKDRLRIATCRRI